MDSKRPLDGLQADPATVAENSASEVSVELLRRARQGDRAAAETLCRRYAPRLRRWAHGRLPARARDLVDTDDLVQEVLMQTTKRMDARFEPRHDGALQAYLRQALHNRIGMEIRRARRRPAAGEPAGEAMDPGPSPLELAVGRESLARYEAALGRLRPEDREAIVLRLEMGQDYQQLAEALHKPSANAARMAVVRALVHLAERIRDGS